MIPYIDLPDWLRDRGWDHIGPIPVDSWGTLVVIGFVLGLEIARARGIKLGLDVRDVVDGIVFTVLSGFIGGHLVHVLAYHPEQLDEQGIMAILKIWAGFSSFGGFIGAVVGITVFYKYIRKVPFWPHADNMMFAFPFAWFFGRLGCFSAHDHIGKPTDSFLGVQFPGGNRFDLGLLEALVAFVIAGVFLVLNRSPRRGGTYAATWAILYAPARFGLDFLRNTDLATADVRWAGLTPAQWGCIVMFGGGLAVIGWLRRQPAEAGV